VLNLFFLNRSPSNLSAVDGPPSTRRRSRSPSDATHDVESRSAKDNKKDQHLESRVAAIGLSNSVSTTEKDTEKLRETAQRTEFAKLLNTRSGGMYIPPARLRAMQEAASLDKTSPEYQRLSWDALRKSITGIVNRVNITNIKLIMPELFAENLIRGRGLFARSIMKAQAASLPFTPVFAALVAIINTKLPQVGELVLTRIISQFRKSFKRNNKVGVFLNILLLIVTEFLFYFIYSLLFLFYIDCLSFHDHLSRPSSQSIPRT
jgi:pre-mRNA-splicing factor CWC22